jgi:hypothetical protein
MYPNYKDNLMGNDDVKNYDTEMEVADWTENVYKGINHIRVGVWLLVVLEAAKFLIW